ncbi:Eco57I restriction-modification methylase domain-containing protein [Methylotenera sp.]|uniref:Eco57I restriction-modification methylase domain-containing protein n=1 Tax=Methylotenera sp. TaxID=2051956 RepID=UPI002730679F|nr:N-6 DNA methylase [Methylotenera sp.]MDP2071863.1 N-6 DNA methylase [Methylotenera sp.]MDP3005488.1 N-6 DNA methylase [Methylotenera sp.]
MTEAVFTEYTVELDISETLAISPRYSLSAVKKSSGATYTPDIFADFVAEQMMRVFQVPPTGVIRVLDPAVGDGALLLALLNRIPVAEHSRLEVFGYDTDPLAISIANDRLKLNYPDVNAELKVQDFIDLVQAFDSTCEQFDLVIANPPYVRTQIMGAQQAQQLAQDFGLTGRVDLYYPFMLGISRVISADGVTGIITSNRFITTKSGQTVRHALLANFRIEHVWDLGDTKLFDAAVLPAVLLARGQPDFTAATHPTTSISFSSIYETDDPADIVAPDALSALSIDNNKVALLPDGHKFRVRHGLLDNGGNSHDVWRVATVEVDNWLATVKDNTWGTFGDVGKIRVGVKSTADKVFVRSDWDSLPDGKPELLRPLITRKCGAQFRAVKPKVSKQILYTHESFEQGRRAVDISLYPMASSYLNGHRKSLESRKYLIEAGRAWYELWVPQDPAAWSEPKLVFLDISEKPVFWMDLEGGVVNGECYWLKANSGKDADLLWLTLAIANSTFIEAYYDHRFNNKLYAGRRRFITQYVEQFPLPNPMSQAAQDLVRLAKDIYHAQSSEVDDLKLDLDAKVWRIFGF